MFKMRKHERARFEEGTLGENYGISYDGHTHLREEEYEALVREKAAKRRAERAAATAVKAQPKK